MKNTAATVNIAIPGKHETKVRALLEKSIGKNAFTITKSGSITDRIKTYEDACAELGIKPLTIKNFAFISDEAERKNQFAYHQVTTIVKALNEGWFPDWSNSNEYKYRPWFQNISGSGLSFFVCDYVISSSNVGSRLHFKSKELCEYAAEKFKDIYKLLMN